MSLRKKDDAINNRKFSYAFSERDAEVVCWLWGLDGFMLSSEACLP